MHMFHFLFIFHEIRSNDCGDRSNGPQRMRANVLRLISTNERCLWHNLPILVKRLTILAKSIFNTYLQILEEVPKLFLCWCLSDSFPAAVLNELRQRKEVAKGRNMILLLFAID